VVHGASGQGSPEHRRDACATHLVPPRLSYSGAPAGGSASPLASVRRTIALAAADRGLIPDAYDGMMPLDPAKLTILNYPDKALRQKGKAVDPADPEVREVVGRMIELMRQAEGIGLAGPQVGLPWRLFVADLPPDEEEDRFADSTPLTATAGVEVYINPVLSDPAGELVRYEEGCLSLPDIRGQVQRPEIITITATDLEGRAFTKTGSGLLARCWQHEFDHLEGVLIIDRMTQLSRLKNRAAVRELEKSAGPL
jgi:peptide deformylase